jgi:3-dehydroquinate dehydratase I
LKPLKLGHVALGRHHPTVIAPFTDRTPARLLERAVRQGLMLAEARVDLFHDQGAAAVTACIRRARTRLPVLVTVRSASEGGGFGGSEAARLELYRGLLPVADAIDVELAAPIRSEVVKAAHGARCLVVLSHHDFRATPPAVELDRIIARGFRAGADIVKIATHAGDDADCARLAALFARHPERALVVIGMGDHGKKTRVFFPALGSLLTFAALDRSTAPGQLELPAMQRVLATFFPDYAAKPAHRARKRPQRARKMRRRE